MNLRLETILQHIDNGVGIIDVGTDHGYLPLALLQKGYCGKIIASDVNEEPLNKARFNAAAAGRENNIDFRLSDGLAACRPEEIDTIVIAGMGGDTICGILDRAEWCMSPGYRLYLQPMTKAEVLRYWLVNNGFIITEEEKIRDNGSIYQIISAEYRENMYLTDAELFTGKYELATRNKLFIQELEALICRFEKAAEGMSRVQRKKALYGIYSGILSELKEMRNRYDKA